MHRFYAPGETFKDNSITLDAQETRHLRDVLRLKTGDQVSVFDGTGQEFACSVAEITKTNSQLTIIEMMDVASPESPFEITLAATVLNGEKYDLVIQKAVELGYRYWMKSERKSEGDANLLGQQFARQLNATLDQSHLDCVISGGEPTVVLPPSATRGIGGRNQQLALSFLNWYDQNGGWPKNSEMAFVSGGTDGEDGPTDAAGAYVDQHVFSQMNLLRLKPEDYLMRCDAYHFFKSTSGLLHTGPTGTNVCDLRVGLVRKQQGDLAIGF